MKMIIKTPTLLSALSKVSRVVNTKSPVAALNGILFKVTNNELILTASDSNVSIEVSINENIEIIKQGIIIIPKLIVDIVRKLDYHEVAIEVIDDTLIFIKSGKLEFRLNGIEGNTYPEINFALSANQFNIDITTFNNMVNATIFACSNEELRPTLTGLNLSCQNKSITAVATDSFRLAKTTIDIDSPFDFNIIVPAKALS
ncbi:MAG: DNA polymerase III subunit beta, partial [Bacilli bacterium]